MTSRRFILNAGRTSKQGQQINVGKDHAEYEAIVNTMTMNPDDMKSLNIPSGATVRVRSQNGEATFLCQGGKVPQGMIFDQAGANVAFVGTSDGFAWVTGTDVTASAAPDMYQTTNSGRTWLSFTPRQA